jgi:CheY-like chemotaxis protein
VTTIQQFAGRRILVVEDEYLIAMELTDWLTEAGAEVVGPASTVKQALRLVEQSGTQLDGATLDINVRGTLSFPIADELQALGVPFVFCTGYDAQKVPERHLPVRRCEKPIDAGTLMQELARVMADGIDSGAEDR